MDFCSAQSGWLRRKAQCAHSACVSLSVRVFVYLRVSATLSKITFQIQMMAQNYDQPCTLLFGGVIVASVDHLAAYIMSHKRSAFSYMWCCAASSQKLTSSYVLWIHKCGRKMLSQTTAWTLHRWSLVLIAHSKCTVIAMYSHHSAVLAVGLTMFHQSKNYYCCKADVRVSPLLAANQREMWYGWKIFNCYARN